MADSCPGNGAGHCEMGGDDYCAAVGAVRNQVAPRLKCLQMIVIRQREVRMTYLQWMMKRVGTADGFQPM